MRPRLWIEPCAGSAAVALRLVGGPRANPPIGYMGSKRGYARVILAVLGLRQGLGADEVWLADAGPWGPVWRVLTTPGMADAVAAVIRSWEGEEPRALWERLRAQGWGELTTAEEVVIHTWMGAFAYRQGNPDSGWRGDDSGYPISADGIASRVEAVARWLVVGAWSYRAGAPESGGNWYEGKCITLPEVQRRCRPWPVPVRVFPDAASVPIPDDCDGVFLYLDPPYSDVAAVIPPVLAAERLPLGRGRRAEVDAALLAAGFDGSGEAICHLRMAVREVLGAIGVDPEILGSVVERVVIDVVDDLIFRQWAAELRGSDQAVLKHLLSVEDAAPVAVTDPALWVGVALSALAGESLPLVSHLRRALAAFYETSAGAAPKLSEALAGASGALSRGLRVPRATEHGSADLAWNVEWHCRLRARVTQDTIMRVARESRKVTGYAHDLPRAEVLDLARRWSDAGAVVCVSEAEPLDLPGWHHVEITGERVGQKRTFSKQQREWLTLNRAPAWRPSTQQGLFG